MTDEWNIAEDEDDGIVEVVEALEPPAPAVSEVDELRLLLAEARTPARKKMLADRIRRLGG